MNIQDVLMTMLTAVITAIIPVLTTYFIKFINKKAEELELKSNNEYVDTIISSVDNLIVTIVTSLSQTIVETAKKDGTFTKEKAQEVLDVAKKQCIAALNDETKELITKMYNMNVDQYIENKIEEVVNRNKNKITTSK